MNHSPIDFNYQDGLNRYPIQDYIDDNITDTVTNSSNYTSNLSIYIKKLIGEQTENITVPVSTTLKHTYIYNSNLAGEIRFWSFGWYSINNFNPTSTAPNHLVKIDVDGKLKLYYIYNPLINLLKQSDWVDVVNSIAGLEASDTNTNATIVGVQAEILLLQNQFSQVNKENAQRLLDLGAFNDLQDEISEAEYNSYLSSVNNYNRMTPQGYLGEYTTLFNQVKGYITTRQLDFLSGAYQNVIVLINDNPLLTFYLGIGGIAIGFAAGIINNQAYLNDVARQLNSNITYSKNINDAAKNQLHTENDKRRVLVLAEYCSNMSNLTLSQGYINSNIILPQTISNLQTTNITLNGVNISNIFINSNNISNINMIAGFINSNITLFQTIPKIYSSNIYMLNSGNINNIGTAYMNQCSANLLSTSLNTNVGFPTSNLAGGLGDKIIFRNGSATAVPVSIGIDSNYNIWNSMNSNNENSAFNWYFDGTKKLSIYPDRLDTSNLLLYQNGISLANTTKTTILTQTPNVQKKYGFTAICTTSILMPNNITYYKYDIDLRLYTTNKIAPNPATPYRIFKIKVFLSSVYFEVMTSSGIADGILEYTVYMSNETQTFAPRMAGINIAAIGYPNNPNLNAITPGSITLVRSADYNYICVLATVINTNVQVIISDELA